MSVLIIIAIVIGTIIAAALITALFVKKDYAVIKEISINQSNQVVFEYIKLLKNQDNFSKWASMDANMKKTYRGVDGTVGFVSAWESAKKEVGAGEQEIKKIIEGKRIDYELRFLKPFVATSPAFMELEKINEGTTKVKWGFDGHMQYPLNLMFLFIDFEKAIGEDFQIGLNKLKGILEK
jgi:hypothetical protein